MSSLQYMPTGIAGLDALLLGRGIPRSHMVFILGGPGTGKTTLGLQLIHEGVRQFNEPGVVISLDEDPNTMKVYARNMGWDFDALEKEKKVWFIDASPIRHEEGRVQVGRYTISIGKKDFSLRSLLQIIEASVSEIGAKRLLVDPLALFVLQYPSEVERRNAVMELMQGIVNTGCTAFLVSELTESSSDRAYQFEEYLAQGVLLMRKMVRPGGVTLVIQVEKMKGLDHDTQPHPYKITQNGIEIYPTEIAI